MEEILEDYFFSVSKGAGCREKHIFFKGGRGYKKISVEWGTIDGGGIPQQKCLMRDCLKSGGGTIKVGVEISKENMVKHICTKNTCAVGSMLFLYFFIKYLLAWFCQSSIHTPSSPLRFFLLLISWLIEGDVLVLRAFYALSIIKAQLKVCWNLKRQKETDFWKQVFTSNQCPSWRGTHQRF